MSHGRPKGLKKTGGRKPGVCNGDVALLRGMILKALDNAGGVDYLTEQARENPGPFLSLIGKVLPRDVTVEASGGITITAIQRTVIDAIAHDDANDNYIDAHIECNAELTGRGTEL